MPVGGLSVGRLWFRRVAILGQCEIPTTCLIACQTSHQIASNRVGSCGRAVGQASPPIASGLQHSQSRLCRSREQGPPPVRVWSGMVLRLGLVQQRALGRFRDRLLASESGGGSGSSSSGSCGSGVIGSTAGVTAGLRWYPLTLDRVLFYSPSPGK